LEGRKAFPFRGGPEKSGWCLNRRNPIVAAFSATDASNIEELGDVGTLNGNAAEYVLVWRIVAEAHIPLSDIVENWTFDRMASFGAYLGMKLDYKSAWTELYSQQTERKKGNNNG